jgi:hypothetical protein
MALNHPLPLPPPPQPGGNFHRMVSSARWGAGGGAGGDGVIWHREEQDKSGKADLEFFKI